MKAAELHEKYMPPTPEQCLEIAEAYIEETGDLPEMAFFALGKAQPDPETAELVLEQLTELRTQFWKAAWNEEPPAYSGEYI